MLDDSKSHLGFICYLEFKQFHPGLGGILDQFEFCKLHIGPYAICCHRPP